MKYIGKYLSGKFFLTRDCIFFSICIMNVIVRNADMLVFPLMILRVSFMK